MKLISVNSGSSGNCFIIEHKDDLYFIDVGVSMKMIKSAYFDLTGNVFDFNRVKGTFITHCHSDHIKSVVPIFNQTPGNIYLPEMTDAIYDRWEKAKPGIVNSLYYDEIKNRESIEFSTGITFRPFSTVHDAPDSVAYLVDIEDIKFGYITDTGQYPEYMLQNFLDRHHIFMEANYDDTYMDATNHYEPFLKERITGGTGHSSNMQAYEALKYILTHNSVCATVTLGHLSTRTNDKSLVEKHIYDLILKYPHITFNWLHEGEPLIVYKD